MAKNGNTRYLIDIGHPGHVHLFRNVYFALAARGHNITVTIREIPIVRGLLDFYGIPYIIIGGKRDTLFGKAINVLKQDFNVYRLIKENKIELGISSGIVLSHMTLFTKIKTLLFDDDDDNAEPLIVKFGHPFSDSIISPNSISRKSKNTISYNGLHELAYLHPAYFQPDPAVLYDYGIAPGENYFIIRFVAFKGHHDIGHSGISFEQKKRLVDLLRSHGRIFITAEREIEPEFEQFRVPVPPEKMHSFMAFAAMFLGDSQTMTSEAAILGIPALKCNSFAGKLSVPNELEQKYKLCYSFLPENFELLIEKIEELLTINDLKYLWQQRRNILLAEKINVTDFWIWFIENWPESFNIMNANPYFQERFR